MLSPLGHSDRHLLTTERKIVFVAWSCQLCFTGTSKLLFITRYLVHRAEVNRDEIVALRWYFSNYAVRGNHPSVVAIVRLATFRQEVLVIDICVVGASFRCSIGTSTTEYTANREVALLAAVIL